MQSEKKREVERTDLECTIIGLLTENTARDLSDFLDVLYGQALESTWNGAMDPGDRARQYGTVMELKAFFAELEDNAYAQLPEIGRGIVPKAEHELVTD